jgi:F1F0 ATPase subunit 2
MVRMAIAILGFYAVSSGNWVRLVACLLGFVVARVIVTQLAGAPPKAAIGSTKEGCP